MDVTATSTAGAAEAYAGSTAATAVSGTTFAGTLGDQQQRLAAADVLASMPPMVAEQIKRSAPGDRPVTAVHELFKAIQSGEFVPSSEQLEARDCLIATTARAAAAFDSPDAMWAKMREMLGAGPLIQDAVQYAHAEQGGELPRTAVSTREEANAVLGGPIPVAQLNWWETAVRFLVDQAQADLLAASRSRPEA